MRESVRMREGRVNGRVSIASCYGDRGHEDLVEREEA